MRTRERYVEELAETVNALFGNGNIDPAAEEIAESHFPGKALGGEIIEGIRKRLRRVRDVLMQDYEHQVCLLNRRYYTRYRGSPPTTEAEARGCIPGGPGVSSAGIRLMTDGDQDLIWQATTPQNIASGAGKWKKSVDQTLDAVEQKRLTAPRVASLIDRGRQRAAPEKPKLAAKVMKALPRQGKDTQDK